MDLHDIRLRISRQRHARSSLEWFRRNVGNADPNLVKAATKELEAASAHLDEMARELAKDYRIKLGVSSELMVMLKPDGVHIYEFPKSAYGYGQGQYVISFSGRVVYRRPPEKPVTQIYLA